MRVRGEESNVLTVGCLQALESSLRWRNIAPTAPDTLGICVLASAGSGFGSDLSCVLAGCYPFQDNDPFIIDECPHIYFAGNQKEYATGVIQGTYYTPSFPPERMER
jgi:DNA polymerase delta subunit 2